MCTRTSTPLSAVKPIACNVGNNVVTVPSTGATTFPLVGSIPNPFPKTPLAKASSLRFDKGTILPVKGETTTSFFTSSFFSVFFFSTV